MYAVVFFVFFLNLIPSNTHFNVIGSYVTQVPVHFWGQAAEGFLKICSTVVLTAECRNETLTMYYVLFVFF